MTISVSQPVTRITINQDIPTVRGISIYVYTSNKPLLLPIQHANACLAYIVHSCKVWG